MEDLLALDQPVPRSGGTDQIIRFYIRFGWFPAMLADISSESRVAAFNQT